MTSLKALDSTDSYTIAWISALPIERAAAEAMLDQDHEPPTISLDTTRVYGTSSAATTASSLLASLPSIRISLLVGIGGGIARPSKDQDIRLGDIIVSQPDRTIGGVCQYDLFKAEASGKRERKGFLGRPPIVLLNAFSRIQANHERKDFKAPYYL
ncbi:pfs domain-containing protein [Verticillium dahliae VdLs.17]|uniref:Pfs domain-containing protein n=1 Tax=Verticillium dahliae (strain VdLs.17 / ATCC MYA-4575 / FGSC 10137) TaxID=498257 RepID=G2X821_VERDV|nr:pfs domain-containing protein [Verticillium dahliae VdLs.17]EGY15108.1 pfs domain-containing protein [Verticillium dahliae VdLs.17]